MYAVYDLKENEICIGIFDTGVQVAEFLDVGANRIYDKRKSGIVKNRYYFMKLEREGV